MSSKSLCQSLWADAVKARDKCTCQRCGYSVAYEDRVSLHGHHISFRSQGNWQVMYSIEDGETLCPQCHEWQRGHNQEYLDHLSGRVEIGRWQAISALLEASKEAPKVKPDYKVIAAKLKERKKLFLEQYFLDLDMDAGYRGLEQ